MSFGFYRLGSSLDQARARERFLSAAIAEIAGYGRPQPDDPDPPPIGDPPPEPILLDAERDPPVLTKTTARHQGYTGDSCDSCGSVRMQVAGHCTVCADCGTTTGCS